MNAENSNQLKHSWERELSKLSEAGQNFVAVARRDAYSYAHGILCMPDFHDELKSHIHIARHSYELSDPDREVLRKLSRLANEISEKVGYDERYDWYGYFQALSKNLTLAEPEENLFGDLRRIEERFSEVWAEIIAYLDPVDAEFAKQIVEDKKQRGPVGSF